MRSQAKLRRLLGPLTLSFYGVGVMVGAGIYVLIGKVAETVGSGVAVAFLTAALAGALGQPTPTYTTLRVDFA